MGFGRTHGSANDSTRSDVRRILLNHLLSREFGQGPFLALPITASDGIELDQSLTSRVRSCRCAQLFLDILHQRGTFPILLLREQDLAVVGLGIRAQTVRFS